MRPTTQSPSHSTCCRKMYILNRYSDVMGNGPLALDKPTGSRDTPQSQDKPRGLNRHTGWGAQYQAIHFRCLLRQLDKPRRGTKIHQEDQNTQRDIWRHRSQTGHSTGHSETLSQQTSTCSRLIYQHRQQARLHVAAGRHREEGYKQGRDTPRMSDM